MSVSQPHDERLPLPAGVNRHRIDWPYASTLLIWHLGALLALFPWFFSWTGVVLALAGFPLFGGLGITLGYHRLLTHRGLRCPRWLEYSFAMLGLLSMQDTPARWVAVHRLHHARSDEQPDPHSPLVSFFWGHIGWMLVENRDLYRLGIYDRYAKDILRDPFYRRLEKHHLHQIIVVGSWVAYFLVGFAVALAGHHGAAAAFQFGASLVVWGVFVRAVMVWHSTWLVNSATHLWGYRNYETADSSRNNWFVAAITGGEGWHNNHHADPRSASHGHRPMEIDWVFGFIRLLERMGLAWDVVRPSKNPPGVIRR